MSKIIDKKKTATDGVGVATLDLQEKFDAMTPEQQELYKRQVQKLAAKRRSEKGLPFSLRIEKPTWWHKISLLWPSWKFYKANKYKFSFSDPYKNFIIRQSTMITLDAATAVLLDMDLDAMIAINEAGGDEDMRKAGIEFANNNRPHIVKIIAICINNYGADEKRIAKLEKFFEKHLTADTALDIFSAVVTQMGIDNFLSLTALVPAINLATYAKIKQKDAQSAKKKKKDQ